MEDSSTIEAIASAPGKAILFGEHAVVYGIPAVAAALSDLRIIVTQTITIADTPSLRIVFEDIRESDEKTPIAADIDVARVKEIAKATEDAFQAVNPTEQQQTLLPAEFSSKLPSVAQGCTAISYLFVNIVLPALEERSVRNGKSFSVVTTIKSAGLPIGAGLGSSAAFSVAAAAVCLNSLYKLKPNSFESLGVSVDQALPVFTDSLYALVNKWAFAGEILMHGNPSGLDNTTSCYGGLIKYIRRDQGSSEFEKLQRVPALKILLTNTKVPRSTKALVAGVRQLFLAYPSIVQPIFNSIGEITEQFLSLISRVSEPAVDGAESVENSDALTLVTTRLVNINHSLLCAIGVGHPALDAVKLISEQAGFACKLTGAGGGGCAITLLPSKVDDETTSLINAMTAQLSERGYEVLSTDLGGAGVKWH